ncbi:MAG: ABC-ATPase UvrA, partial [Planctomycetia bacterium]|nr:ABC-ATPase UvrA [Planctomycetia bacterium]
VDVDIPVGRFVVLTGPSGSGKSTLAFDTLFAEGQRQYIESLSTHSRQFIRQMERPDLESVENLPPTIAISQRGGVVGPRDTVATETEIHDYLRVLMARLGVAHCPRCGGVVRRTDPESVLDWMLDLPDGTRLILMAPLVREAPGNQAEVFQTIRRSGFIRARIDGVYTDMEHLPTIDPQRPHTIEAVVDRLIVRHIPSARPRFAESLRLALKLGDSTVMVAYETAPKEWKDRSFCTGFACPGCHARFEELEPRHFSFSSPYGACPICEGLGVQIRFDPELLVPDPGQPVRSSIVAWKKYPAIARRFAQTFRVYLEEVSVDATRPWNALTPEQRDRILHGDESHRWPGVTALLENEYQRTTASESGGGKRSERSGENEKSEDLAERRRWWEQFRSEQICPECGGSRLRAAPRSVTFAGRTIHELVHGTIPETLNFFQSVKIRPELEEIAVPLLAQIRRRLECLIRLGLGYLTLDRPIRTLSGGEYQRVRLVCGLGSGLAGVCYVLDEPSIGLHPRDNAELIRTIRDLQNHGENTVIVVEHDDQMIRQADWLIDTGPGAGRFGGQIVDQGPPGEVAQRGISLTG